MNETFPDDELPTRPAGLEYRAASILRAWRNMSEKDRQWLERLVAAVSWANQPILPLDE